MAYAGLWCPQEDTERILCSGPVHYDSALVIAGAAAEGQRDE